MSADDLEGDDIWGDSGAAGGGDSGTAEESKTADAPMDDLEDEETRENQEKVKVNKQLPYLVANVVEILEPDAEDGKYKCVSSLIFRLYRILLMVFSHALLTINFYG